MSSIVTSILSSTIGLLWNKARDATAKGLQDGDITDAKIREIVVRELNDIKTKIDGLSRKDLLSSYSFLQEGVQLLNASLDKSKDEQNAVQSDHGETSSGPSGDESADILNKALELSCIMGKLKIVSNEFETAKERFKDARKRATDAFCNEALNIQDRIFATKLRVVSNILECLDNPDTAVTSCLLFLEELHGLPAVRKIFSVHLGRGVKSILNKAERVKNVKSVMMINYVTYQFVSKYSSKYCSALAWPTIQPSDGSFNPICSWQEVSTRTSWGEDLIQPPNELRLDEFICRYNSAVNSRGEILVGFSNYISVIFRTGNSKGVFEYYANTDKENMIRPQIVGLAVDQENNVYVALYFETTSENVDNHAVLLYIMDEHCNQVKHESELNFLPKLDETSTPSLVALPLAINKNNNIVMAPNQSKDLNVYVCDKTGQLKYKFAREYPYHLLCCTSVSNNEIMLASFHGDAVEVYTEEGNLKLKIKLPAGHKVCGAAFHFVICKIIVLSYYSEKEGSCFLHRYSETGELETSMFFCNTPNIKRSPDITSHPRSPVAIVGMRTITYI
ncbi:Hypothetical predicted protein [Paramuricea clavata]|uniref:Uncharacterized protein n=1 Tax=Paramuricea clavata TaxID=317549 RepID=A0A7D9EJ62_PARCT|nr:Hypothetical predicted protein [Paramuricea clavata]